VKHPAMTDASEHRASAEIIFNAKAVMALLIAKVVREHFDFVAR
jgi:hypothetical protein